MEYQLSVVPHICNGVIHNKIKDTELYEVTIHESPLGPLANPIYATAIHPSGLQGNYKQGDYVKTMIHFTFSGSQNKIIGVKDGSSVHILGHYNEKSYLNKKVENPLTASGEDKTTFSNKNSGAGISAGDNGELKTASSGSVHTLLKAFGYGLNEDIHQVWAQNHKRVIGNNSPFYLCLEQFGMYSGSDDDDKLSKTTDEDNLIIFRRFVTQTQSPNNWISTCEGTCAPLVGPNNDSDLIEVSKEVLFSKIVNHGASRATIEMGEPGSSFINLRIDDVKRNEEISSHAGSPNATPAKLGNRFKLTISDKGAVDIKASGEGTPFNNKDGFHLSISETGELKIHSKGKISISHGDNDESKNSIVLDPKKGIDITAKKGFRVNGLELVTKKFIDWMNENKKMLCQVTSIGGPAPIHPTAIPGFTQGVASMNDNNGFTTKNEGAEASGEIKDKDDTFHSI